MHGWFARATGDNCHGRIVVGMSSQQQAAAVVAQAASAVPAAPARGVTVTWWYTATAIMFFELMLIFVWTTTLFAAGLGEAGAIAIGVGGLIWFAATTVLLFDHRPRLDADEQLPRGWVIGIVMIAAAFGVALGVLSGSWLLGIAPVAQALVMVHWPRGVRMRVTIGLTLAMVCAWIVDGNRVFGDGILVESRSWGVLASFSLLAPLATVSSLWWWEVLVTLDRARAAEGRLAATQERLRLATDVHDLQGHHLQVIALQLELAERLMDRDPDAALEQLRLARASVDDARQGTRDLATRFRSVPLGDELANARDLLRAAGLEVETTVAVDAGEAPASALGPVIRETTTNVLRHGGGARARLSLARDGAAWRYEIVNDALPDVVPSADGAGLEGIARRLDEAGGTLEVRRGGEEFAVVATVPAAEVVR